MEQVLIKIQNNFIHNENKKSTIPFMEFMELEYRKKLINIVNEFNKILSDNSESFIKYGYITLVNNKFIYDNYDFLLKYSSDKEYLLEKTEKIIYNNGVEKINFTIKISFRDVKKLYQFYNIIISKY